VFSKEELLEFSILSFKVLQQALEVSPPDEQEDALRNQFLRNGATKLLLATLSLLTHQSNAVSFIIKRKNFIFVFQNCSLIYFFLNSAYNVKLSFGSSQSPQSLNAQPGTSSGIHRQQNFWASGTGFGTGATENYSSTPTISAMDRRKVQDKQIAYLSQALSAFVWPLVPDSHPVQVSEELQDQMHRFHTIPAIYQLLENDSGNFLIYLFSYL